MAPWHAALLPRDRVQLKAANEHAAFVLADVDQMMGISQDGLVFGEDVIRHGYREYMLVTNGNDGHV